VSENILTPRSLLHIQGKGSELFISIVPKICWVSGGLWS